MNETRGNARTKPKDSNKIKTIEDYRQILKHYFSLEENERELLKEREMNSLKDSEKTNELRIKGCLLHNSDLWKTPKFIYEYYNKKGFFDPCPTNPTFNGLNIDWKSFNFVNPPYSQISKWIDKALKERKRHCNSVLLIPARTDTKWFRKLVESKVNIAFIQGRLHFNDEGPAPFPSMFVWINCIFMDKTSYDYITKEDLENYFK